MNQPHPQQHLMDYVERLEASHKQLLEACKAYVGAQSQPALDAAIEATKKAIDNARGVENGV